MNVITDFDPWKSKLCTCPKKYSFSPYTGCYHGCIYCYVTYIPNFGFVRPKKDLISRLRRDLSKIENNALISMSNSSDPYPPMEKDFKLTRKALMMLSSANLRILILTKSDIVKRDADLLSKMKAAVSITITTLESDKAGKMEPNAPDPIKRLKALKYLKSSGIPVILRLDPILPLLTEEDVEEVLEKCKFVDHVVTSTLKIKPIIYKRIIKVFPELKHPYKELYFVKGEKIGGSYYLPLSLRKKILEKVRKVCNELGLSVAFCREGISFNAVSCDGSHLTTKDFNTKR